MSKVFLGGTCNDSSWRGDLMPVLQVPYFNPVVEDWTPECQAEEEVQKYKCRIHLYVITSAMTGVFSIAEVIESAMSPGKLTVLQIMPDGFSKFQLKSLIAVANMVLKHGGVAYVDKEIHRAARIINNCFS